MSFSVCVCVPVGAINNKIIEITLAELLSGYIREHWGAKHTSHASVIYDLKKTKEKKKKRNRKEIKKLQIETGK